MKFSPALKGLVVVAVLATILGALWLNYKEFLNQGRSAPTSSKILNQIEKDGLPDFTLHTLSGEEVNLRKFAGKAVVLNFWASWCDPCVAEFPSLQKLIEHFKGEIVLIAVSADYEEVDIHNFLKTFKVQSPDIHVVWDKDKKLADQLGTDRLPESYIIGRDGKLVRKIAGVDNWATNDAFSYFEDLLKKH